MKKILFVCILFLTLVFTIQADDLADLLQDLAVQTACLGMYSTAETGVYVTSRHVDPPDWYTPRTLANRFAAMSGYMTRINTFYGVCFDYAQFAWDDIKKYQKTYNDAGMKGTQWYIAATDRYDSNNIILYDPVSRENATIIMNGVSVREHSHHRIRAHDDAKGHAWLWVQHKNGTWYWIDPTWTDNTGYVWWGIVKDGIEATYLPDPKYCVASNYPRPPRPNETPSEKATRSSNSTYISYSGNPTYYSGNYNPIQSNYLLIGYNYVFGLPIGLTIADSMFFVRSLIYISANIGGIPDNFTIEWTYGVAIYVNRFLRIPIGIGANHTSFKGQSEPNSWSNGVVTDYEETLEWEHKLVMEIGLQPVIKDRFYLSGTYRLIGLTYSGFSIGAGIIF